VGWQKSYPTERPLNWSDNLNLWKAGFILIILGIAIPIAYGIYKLALVGIPWYWSLSIFLILSGSIVLLASAIKDKISSEKSKEKY